MRLARVEQLILWSAGTTARRTAAGDRAQRLLAEVDWELLASSLASMRLLTTLGPRITLLAGDATDPKFARELAGALEAGRRHGALLALVAQRLIGMLGEQQIRVSSLKGPLLADALYGDPARRNSTDIDLLVAPDRLADAVAVARGLGYAPPRDRVGEDHLPLLHFGLVHERGELPPVELHWRVHWYESRFAYERLLAPPGGERWLAAPRDELAALLLFYARDGFLGLRQACDIGAWWDAYGDRLSLGELDALIAEYPALAPAVRTALAAAERAVGLPAAQIVSEPARLGRRERVALALSDPCPQIGTAQQYAQMGLIDGLLSPAAGWRAFLARQLGSPRRAERPTPTGVDVAHALRVLGRYALAIAGLLRARVPRRGDRQGRRLDLRRTSCVHFLDKPAR
ncbi:MAG TPA: nucleotidyltransferase family protein [Solirubrobacteraceae bacterium]|jgi:hypothetical protein|nr:nucleotidyltransferase family protein [Solirubrobacteraceae bacterium]